MTTSAKIVISGLEAFAYHGCTPREREEGQAFSIDIELEYNAARAIAADDLAEAVDYDRLATEIYKIATGERYDLIETLASRIGEHIMQSTPASSLLVRVHKPQAPMQREVAEVAVEMAFKRDGL
jgi:dihydroneopterin aldolase